MIVNELVQQLRRRRYRVGQEAWLQMDIEAALTAIGVPFEREARLTTRDRIDFLVAGGIGIEAKTRCSPRQIYRQLERYAAHDAITSLILISGTATGLPEAINGRPLFYISTGRAAL
jgi:hypothetical protein